MEIKLSNYREATNIVFLKQQKNCVYCIRNITNDKIYIGQTKYLFKRIQSHVCGSKKSTLPLYASIRKYGLESFEVTVISNNIDVDQIDFIETYLINYYNSFNRQIGYNTCLIARSTKGVKCSDATKQKLSAITKEQWKNKKWVEDICRKRKETKNTDEYRKACSERILRLKETHPSMDRRRKVEKLDKVTLEVLKVYDSLTTAAKDNTPTLGNIYKCCKGIYHTAGGYRWKYADEELVIKKDRREDQTDEHIRKLVKSRKNNGTEGRKVVNSVTGEIFNSIIAAASSADINKDTLWQYLKGYRKNKTNFRYYIKP